MSQPTFSDIESKLHSLLGEAIPATPISNVNEGLRVADALEAKGYSFALKDLCAKSLSDSSWRATFSLNGQDAMAENADAAVAICVAALAALENQTAEA
ncbi:hypothetical protein GO013_02680 [Pseudodesulfovibrio sp. JC047]|uniref:hypothetical protein n=1 Tax=Pseudodesulfovibrio sp. JC047 TaxID=2683199 RepID=UPI0013D59AD4|nr:hypothetical protein [Pseudodesulfovibrio sp. JC047]NDV18321.1 hypothetical protein [Pseudodesulfovibrio sp. JC047]